MRLVISLCLLFLSLVPLESTLAHPDLPLPLGHHCHCWPASGRPGAPGAVVPVRGGAAIFCQCQGGAGGECGGAWVRGADGGGVVCGVCGESGGVVSVMRRN
jgi:hypothetical protein